jgi:CubicO group peptidase (beta-lactamase class C family)
LKKIVQKLTIILLAFLSLIFQNCNTNKQENSKNSLDNKLSNEARFKAQKLDSLFEDLYKKGVFNGNVMVVENEQVIYRKAIGFADFATKRKLKINTPFQLASVSKQFTAVAIMQLAEKGKLKYSDSAYKYLPFPFDSSITIFSLLTHSSGIPNYIYCLDKVYDKSLPLSNQLVVSLMAEHKPGINYKPNSHFNYNNSNYMYLAAIVERLSGLDFRTYAQKYLFAPAGMKNSFVYDPSKPESIKYAAQGFDAPDNPIYTNYLDGVVGDKGVYATVDDLLLWDKALNTNKLIKANTLADALRPKLKFDNLITKNYGFGWRMKMLPDSTWQTFHTGWWHGFQTFYQHDAKNKTAIICLSNHANGYMSNIKKVQAILYPEKAKYFIDDEDDEQVDSVKVSH